MNDKDREDLMFYWTQELPAKRRQELEARMERDPDFQREADRLFSVLGAVIGDPTHLRRSATLPPFDSEAFFDEALAESLPRPRPRRSWTYAAAAALLLAGAFLLGAWSSAPPQSPPPRISQSDRLRAAYSSSTKGEDGLARGLLALSALSQKR